MLMRSVQCERNLCHGLAHEPQRQPMPQGIPPRVVQLVQIDAVHVLLHHVRGAASGADVKRAHHVGARNARHEPRFAQHALGAFFRLHGEVGLQRLDDDWNREVDVASEPHVAHASAAQASPDLVLRDPRAGFEHGFNVATRRGEINGRG